MSWRRLLVLTSVLALVGCSAPEILIEDARVRTPVPGTDKTVGYFSLTNRTTETLTLVGAHAEAVRAIELHTTKADSQGFTRMRRLSEVSVASNETVVFTKGGHHLMLFGVDELGEDLQVSLQFKERDSLSISFKTIGLLD